MNLLVDIGNSNLKWTCMSDGPWRKAESVPVADNVPGLLGSIWGEVTPTRRMLVSNVSGKRMEDAVRSWSSTNWGIDPVFFRSEERFRDIHNEYRDPCQLGCDRWAAIIGARSLSAGHLCVVDCGTAVTIDALTGDGRFIGGIIFPGAALVRESLLAGTSDISEQGADFSEVLGQTTAECVSGGSNFGVAGAVDSILDEMASVLDKPALFITGGGARFLLPFLHHSPRFEPDLVLIGLAQTLE